MFTKGQVFNARRSIQKYRMDLVSVKEENPEPVMIGDIKIFPTINTGRLFIDFGNRFKDEEVILHVYDLNGKLIQVETLVGGIRNDIHLDLYVNGLYSIVLFVGEDIRFKDRIVFTKQAYKRIEFDDDIDGIIQKEYEK
jgi:hypothetical protein